MTREELIRLRDRDMRGLTLWRPWDQSIVRGGKPVENRPWPPPRSIVGKLIALHAGKTYDHEGVLFMRRCGYEPPAPEQSPAGVIVGVVALPEPVTHRGAQGLWPLHWSAVQDVVDQLIEAAAA